MTLTLTKDQIDVLDRFRLVSTPRRTEITDTMRHLYGRGLLSIRPVDRHLARVVTTDEGMEALGRRET